MAWRLISTRASTAEPGTEVVGVRQRGRQRHDTYISSIPGPRNQRFQNRPAIFPEQVDLVQDHQSGMPRVVSPLEMVA